jgi:hypothetical protein
MEEARQVMSGTAPNLDRARSMNRAAARADAYSPLPWMALAEMEYQNWLAQGSPPSKTIWRRIDGDLKGAVRPPRNPRNLQVQRFRMNILRELLRRNATGSSTTGLAGLRNEYINAAARAVELYPTNATLRADLAQACSADGRFAEAARQAREALRLDAITPHRDKKLKKPVRERLKTELPRWDAGESSSPPKLPEGVELPPELRRASRKK